ncbi:MAG: dimethyl sulfoxide reductase anchor subunit family protein [Burkholderiales bacterium]
MRPAFSVIFLTTLIGVGQGLFIALFAAEAGARLDWLGATPHTFFVVGSAIAFVFLAAGLIASFFHLGRPERAWRAAAMWRTSWLSREVIVLPAFMIVTLAYGAMHYAQMEGTLVVGAVGVAVCIALFVCTGMIYACIRFLQEWAHPLTIVNFIVLGCASGFTFAAAYAWLAAPELAGSYTRWAVAFTLIAFCTRIASLMRNARLKPRSSLQSAIGVKHPKIAQKAQGFMGGSFNTREFFHGRPATVLRAVKWGFLSCAFALPALLLAIAASREVASLVVAAFVVQYVGLVAERWYFFAQARHPQNLYYQAIS